MLIYHCWWAHQWGGRHPVSGEVFVFVEMYQDSFSVAPRAFKLTAIGWAL